MTRRPRQTTRELLLELALVVALIGALYVFTFSGAGAERSAASWARRSKTKR